MCADCDTGGNCDVPHYHTAADKNTDAAHAVANLDTDADRYAACAVHTDADADIDANGHAAGAGYTDGYATCASHANQYATCASDGYACTANRDEYGTCASDRYARATHRDEYGACTPDQYAARTANRYTGCAADGHTGCTGNEYASRPNANVYAAGTVVSADSRSFFLFQQPFQRVNRIWIAEQPMGEFIVGQTAPPLLVGALRQVAVEQGDNDRFGRIPWLRIVHSCHHSRQRAVFITDVREIRLVILKCL
jgi:hypothetical protein